MNKCLLCGRELKNDKKAPLVCDECTNKINHEEELYQNQRDEERYRALDD